MKFFYKIVGVSFTELSRVGGKTVITLRSIYSQVWFNPAGDSCTLIHDSWTCFRRRYQKWVSVRWAQTSVNPHSAGQKSVNRSIQHF